MEKLTEEQLKVRILEAKGEIVEKTLKTKEYMRRLDGDGYRSMVEQIASRYSMGTFPAMYDPYAMGTISTVYEMRRMLGD